MPRFCWNMVVSGTFLSIWSLGLGCRCASAFLSLAPVCGGDAVSRCSDLALHRRPRNGHLARDGLFFWGGRNCNTNLRKLMGLGCGKKSEASSCPKNGADMCRLEGKKLLTAWGFQSLSKGEVEAKEPKHPLPLRIHHSNIRHCDVRPWCWQDQTNKSNHILSNLHKSHATTCVWIQYVYIFIDP